MKGSIEVICGPMFSGKTEELIRRIKRGRIAKQNVLIFKPRIDDRYSSNDLASHSGYQERAVPISTMEEGDVAYQNYLSLNGDVPPDIVAVEEVQFFQPDVIKRIISLKNDGVRVIAAGLDMDWRGQPFNITANLLSLANKVDKLTAVCLKCGENATHSFKKEPDERRVEVGSEDLYEARCYRHWRR